MITGKQLTIRDYFKQANASNGDRSFQHPSRAKLPMDQGGFTRTLEAAQAAEKNRSQGRTIRDYIKNPVHTRSMAVKARSMALETTHQEGRAKKGSVAKTDKTAKATRTRRAVTAHRNVTQRINAGVDEAAAKYELPPNLIHAVIRAESNYQVRAVSPAGAKGLMQLMPSTAKELGVRNSFNIEQNIDGGAKYLHNMLARYDGDLKLALSAYNAGPGNVDKYNGQVPFAETRTYVERVLRYARQS